MKERALELAKKLEWYSNYPDFVETGEMIRRLVEELDKQDKELVRFAMIIGSMTQEIADKQGEPVAWLYAEEYPDSDMEGGHVESFDFNQPSKYQKVIWEKPLYTTPQTKPLSDDEIRHIYQDYWLEDHGQIVDFVRAIEERYGIK